MLTRDGEVWLIPSALPGRPGDQPAVVVEFSHAFAAAGRDVQLAFTALLRVDGDRIVVEELSPRSGHYNLGNTVQENSRIVHLAAGAFRLHGLLVYDAQPGDRLANPAALADPGGLPPGTNAGGASHPDGNNAGRSASNNKD